MGGRGSGGARGRAGSSRAQISVDEEFKDSYGYREIQKEMMSGAIEDAEQSINTIMSDSYMEKDADHLYEALADYYPRAMESNDAEKVIDARNDYVTTIDFSILDNYRTGKLEINLRPHSYHYDEFSTSELEDMGIERRK